MNYLSLIICFIVNIIISIGIPLGILIYFAIKKKQFVKPFLVGALVFLVSQVVLRIPLLNGVVAKTDWFYNMSVLNPILYAVFLGLTAGIFEEVGRFIGFEIGLKKNRRWYDGIAFGLGHGGIEAILFAGISSIQNLYVIFSLNNGTFNSSLVGASEETVRGIFDSTSSIMVLYGGIERISAIIMHIGFTMLVLYGINKGKKALYLLWAILAHGVVDTTVVVVQQAGASIHMVELICIVFAIILLFGTIKVKGRFDNFKGVEENEKVY
ncbi:YhfC family intramembrane metalloprotease [Clostridium sp. NSJ-49]|uniref:YhfC family intramembrane metalloprotease n=3 Tax=Clostridium TaxID=1485 RepID=UPI00164BA400|nr:YhfC family glutamic-type intramembrane protease [Clostridium sp. NSJ-49]MBC5624564.1 YhfC family intramembrane metalloprotease [Clostridium sp. NSJ-49]